MINRNTAIIFSLLLLYSLVSYYYIVELTDHQSYITNDDNIRLGIIHYGFLMCNSLLLGSAFGIFFYSNNKINLNFEAIFLIKKNENVILILAWIPIVINLILYLFFFSGREYVFVHVSGAGFLGKLMNTKFLTFGAILLLSINDVFCKRYYRSVFFLFCGIVVVFGLFMNVRSTVLISFMLLIYYYKNKIGNLRLSLSAFAMFFLFVLIGYIRDPSFSNFLNTIYNSFFSIGEFPEVLRFVMDDFGSNNFKFGGHIFGTFFGFSEPIANIYTKHVSIEYFYEGGGFGSYIIAEFLFSFGWYGAILAFFIFGIFISRIMFPFKWKPLNALNPMVFAFSFPLLRNDFGVTARAILYSIISMILLSYISRLKKVF